MFDSGLVDPRHDDLRAAADAPIQVPRLLVLGARDACIDPDMARGAGAAFHGPYEERTIACGHFPQLERADDVADLAATWLARG